MNILTDKLPDLLNIGGRNYKINTDYQIGIHFEKLMLDDTISDEEKLIKAKELYFSNSVPPMVFDEETTDKLVWFYCCGKFNEKTASKSNDRVYDFDYDSSLIYAAFKEQYNIELSADLKMHWWKFKALFNAISEDTEFVKIIGYRTVKINGSMSPAQKRFYQKMKRLYKLPVSEAQEKQLSGIEQALLNGESLKDIL